MVIADPHVLDTTLFDDGSAFTSAAAGSSRVLEHSLALFDSAMTIVAERCPDLLFVTGDLTNDGEKESHEHVVAKLTALREAGVQPIVIPGNNDIANRNAKRYSGSSRTSSSSVTADEYKELYADFGYNQAVAKEENGLSYMVYPVEKLAVICLNSTKENTPTVQYNAGGLTEETLSWAEEAAAKAQEDGRMILAMMHHQALGHFNLATEMVPTYVANTGDEYPDLYDMQDRLVAAGIEVVFTGHFHITSIKYTTTTDGFGELYDVSTGSLSSYPSPIRTLSLSEDGVLHINTEVIDTYHALELTRNGNTAKGLLSAVANRFYPMVDSIRNLVPAMFISSLNLPNSASQMATDMQPHLLEPMTDLVNALSAGDEDMDEPDVKLQACMDGFDAYIAYICNGNAFATLAFKTAAVAPKLVLRNMCRSVFYNFVGLDSTDIVSDNANVLYINVPSISTAIEEVAADGLETTKILRDGELYIKRNDAVYTITGIKVE